jgi:mRNA deadenylase 3'-5' endonuclease subunit Ccr4
MTPNINRFVKDIKTLGKVKVLTFNNLACIYKKKRMFGIALRSVSFAL